MVGIVNGVNPNDPDAVKPGIIGGITPETSPENRFGGFDAERIELDPTSDTVEGRIEGLIAKNSAPMQSAKTRAIQDMNRRGLVNTSMAVGAGQRALYDYALPIASQDAQTSFAAKGLNQAAINRAGEFTAGQRNIGEGIILQGGINERLQAARGDIDLKLQELRGDQTTALTSQQAEIEKDLLSQRAQIDLEMQNLRGDQAMDLAGLEFKHKNILQTSTNASMMMAQSTATVGQILANPDLTGSQKDYLIAKESQLLDTRLNTLNSLSNVDVSGTVNFGGSGGGGSGLVGGNTVYTPEQKEAAVEASPTGAEIGVNVGWSHPDPSRLVEAGSGVGGTRYWDEVDQRFYAKAKDGTVMQNAEPGPLKEEQKAYEAATAQPAPADDPNTTDDNWIFWSRGSGGDVWKNTATEKFEIRNSKGAL